MESKFLQLCESILEAKGVSALQALKDGGFVVTDSIAAEKRSWLELKESAKLSKELKKKGEELRKLWMSKGEDSIDLDELDKRKAKLNKEYAPKFKEFQKSTKERALAALDHAGIKYKKVGAGEVFGDDFAISFSGKVVVLKRNPSKAYRAGIDD